MMHYDSGWVGASPADDLDRRLAADSQIPDFNPSRPHVMTVGGPIDPGSLGLTLVWERLVAPRRGASTDEVTEPHQSLAELDDVAAAGAWSMVHAAPLEDDLEAAMLGWLAARSPVHLVVTTGAAGVGPTALNEAIARFRDGFGATGVRPGAIAIEVGAEPEALAGAIRTVAQAALVSSAPVVLSAAHAVSIARAIERLVSEGLRSDRIVVGGADTPTGEDVLRASLDRGTYVVVERGVGAEQRDRALADLVVRAVDAGHGERLLIGSGLRTVDQLRAYGGGPGWVDVLERFPLALMDAGLEARAVRRLLVDNPARALTIERGGA
jgi:phosphotriesterase-related protein